MNSHLDLDTLRDKWRHLVVHCRKKKYDVYIGRASGGAPSGDACKWGNPFPMRNQSDEERERVSYQYREWIYGNRELVAQARSELRGKVLACWCDPKYCHGHILAEIANTPQDDVDQDIKISAMRVVSKEDDVCAGGQPDASHSRSKKKPKDKPKSQLAQYLGTDSTVFRRAHKTGVATSTKDIAHHAPIASYSALSVSQTAAATDSVVSGPVSGLVDIGVNYTNKDCKKDWDGMMRRAHEAGVSTVVLTGTCLSSTEESMRFIDVHSSSPSRPNLCPVSMFFTVGVHPHKAKTFTSKTISKMREILLRNSKAVAVGECGLDFNRNHSTPDEQIQAFREQVCLACELNMPLFVHERDAHSQLLEVLDEFGGVAREPSVVTGEKGIPEGGGETHFRLPPLVVHCFTGGREEALEYIARGFYIGFTGTICKHQRGEKLREMIASGDVPLHRIMLETDAPYMGFVKTRRNSEPGDVALVAEMVAKLKGVTVEEVRRVTAATTQAFFGLN